MFDRIIRAWNRELRGPMRAAAKKKLPPFYQQVKENNPARSERLRPIQPSAMAGKDGFAKRDCVSASSMAA